MKLLFLAVFFLSGHAKGAEFSEEAWKHQAVVYQAILDHPFNQELASGKLPQEKFDYYSVQDAIYLKAFSQALSLLASKLKEEVQIRTALGLAADCLQESPLSKPKRAVSKAMSANVFYTSYLLSVAAFGSAEELAAALLPCFRIYLEVAASLIRKSPSNNPHHQWLKSYSSSNYAATVDKVTRLTDDLARGASSAMRQKMLEAYTQAFQLEWYFWQDAYALGHWLPRAKREP